MNDLRSSQQSFVKGEPEHVASPLLKELDGLNVVNHA
jgi:hypothetical protein